MLKHRKLLKSSFYVVLFMAGLSFFATAKEGKESAVVLNVNDAIGPATYDYIHRGLEKAAERNASVIILQLDTPGGLDISMRNIIHDIISSPVPVILYVAPSGSRAASAGTYMLYAAHIAAMAPATNLGAATPVQIGGFPGIGSSHDEEKDNKEKGKNNSEQESPTVKGDAMTKKIVNDAIAYIRGLAEMRGRNADWAEKAVREGVSLSSDQALQMGVIDIIAKDKNELLTKVNGWHVDVNGRDVTLDTDGLEIVSIEPDWRNELLSVITNPNIAYILMLLGIYGLFFELANPGYVLPGVIGAVSLLLALYALQLLPVNYAGVGLIILGIVFMVAEIFVPSFGALGIGGITSFVIGSVILFDADVSQYRVAIPIIIAVTVVSAMFILMALRMVFSAHKKPVVSGVEELQGSIGIVMNDFDHEGHIYVHSETWQARSRTPLKKGDRVKVKAIEGLVLMVEPVKEET